MYTDMIFVNFLHKRVSDKYEIYPKNTKIEICLFIKDANFSILIQKNFEKTKKIVPAMF